MVDIRFSTSSIPKQRIESVKNFHPIGKVKTLRVLQRKTHFKSSPANRNPYFNRLFKTGDAVTDDPIQFPKENHSIIKF
ncbi:hypothetical protein CH380_15645 [Leptospira adleri]|uniref:Uncharacterized protein n=1 Tax=Leptospira adleri TaxID=2023186 RepID=A0A2M9YLA5_9LEPT|nr:hypothetical protein CH380_15645 [Leptospira adleri]PJZ63540.1 hypothetical protein CH376_02665 [Leptospira adleri]